MLKPINTLSKKWWKKKERKSLYGGPLSLVSKTKVEKEVKYEEEVFDDEEDIVLNSDGEAVTYYLRNNQAKKL